VSNPTYGPGLSASVRTRLENLQTQLSPHATRVRGAGLRAQPEMPCPLRTAFQRDRDRIIHTNAFRRLKHKSQVFIAPLGDHYVTRLTHTVEVAQIGRTIARALNLNEDLVEAAALGHDLGHTPFGHIGERAMDRLLPGGFHHSRHSVRIVERLEKEGRGLNLTRHVVDAIRHHSKPQGDFLTYGAVKRLSLESQIVRIADAIAYLAHDICDGIRSGQLAVEDLPLEAVEALGSKHSDRVNAFVEDVVNASWSATGEWEDLGGRPWIRMSDEIRDVTINLRTFMFERFYLPIGKTPAGQAATNIIEMLMEEYLRNPDHVPAMPRSLAGTPEQAAADFVCGMTDQFAIRLAEQLKPGVSGDVFKGRV